MLAIENEYYAFKDILCLLMDMFDKKKPIFYIEDFHRRFYFAPHFFNIMTNFVKFNEFIGKDTYQTPVKPAYSDWIVFANRYYHKLVYGEDDAEGDVALLG